MKTNKCWDNLGAVTIKTWDGKQETYASLEEAVSRGLWFSSYDPRHGDRIQYGFLKHYNPNPLYRDWDFGKGDTKVFLTAEGLTIPTWKVMEAYNNEPHSKRRGSRGWRRGGKFKFRQGPVEGIRCWKAGGYRGHRWIGTHQEIRENDFVQHYDEDAEDYGIKVRGRRRRGNLPTPWDDLNVSDWRAKSWKNYRKHQWKE